MTPWKEGDRVYVIGYEQEGPRVIAALVPDISGGVRLDRPVCGLRYWNMSDLKSAPRSSLH